MSKKDYIGIFGGSFDPIHKGHMESLKSVTEKLNLSKVLVIPNKVSPLKDLSVASSLEKIKMLEIAFSDFKEIEIEDYELKKEGQSFMIETLQHLNKKLGKKKKYNLRDFNYSLPKKFIAQHPEARRDYAKLMVVHKDTGDIEHKKF